MRKKATHRGVCPVCEWKPALMEDGTIYRHYAGFVDPKDKWPGGFCKGWGRKPVEGTVEPIA